MKAISLWQPYASAIAHQLKQYETRDWATKYRGKIAIHAGKRIPTLGEMNSISKKSEVEILIEGQNWLNYSFPFGGIVAIAELTDCLEMAISLNFAEVYNKNRFIEIRSQPKQELRFGNWELGRFAWQLENIQSTEFIPCKGQQGLFEIPDSLLARYL